MNVIRTVSLRAAVLGSLLLGACSVGPTEEDINRTLEGILASVSGEWTGSSTGTNPVTMAFTLTQAGNGAVTGSGTMKETNAAASVPITIAFASSRLGPYNLLELCLRQRRLRNDIPRWIRGHGFDGSVDRRFQYLG